MPRRLDNAKCVAHMPTAAATKNKPSSRDSRLTMRLCRCQKSDSQNASCPGRHQIGTVGEIISESWARSNRYTRARSSESAFENKIGGSFQNERGFRFQNKELHKVRAVT